MKKFVLSLFILSFVFLLAACGGEESSESESTEKADKSVQIEATNFKFDQEEYTVKAGEPVNIEFTSAEGMHGLMIPELNVNIEGDGTKTITPEEPGEYEIRCSIPCGTGHAEMQATLIVQ
ncbi:cupredoxin domain-containing protein [Radiobacillus deserti]|uniref:Cytochrome C oxidase subunit II n=1 Tax=Radiobacillus deserti TaxID=2594883 RepID=A0A516KCJ9_9BACI|nr:cupredoxin domain-containing protein [Radiobacillus deserti]QDP39135.1 cytochrome C oxidase subunit II [Radiobacillus deserti]